MKPISLRPSFCPSSSLFIVRLIAHFISLLTMKFQASLFTTNLAAVRITSALSADDVACPGVNDPPKTSLNGGFKVLAQKSDLAGTTMLIGQGSDIDAPLWTLEPKHLYT